MKEITISKKEAENLRYWLNIAEDYIGSREALDKSEELGNKKELEQIREFKKKLNVFYII